MSVPIWPPIRLPYHPPLDAWDIIVWLLGWVICRALCFVGVHAWVYTPGLYVPLYGSGHEQCVMCDLIKVKP